MSLTGRPLHDDLDPALEPWWRRRYALVADWLILLTRPTRVPATWLPPWREPRFLIVGAAILVPLILVTMLLVDSRAIIAARTLPPAFIVRFEQITNYGLSGWFLYPLGVILVVAALIPPPPLRRFTHLVYVAVMLRVSFLFLAVGVPGLFVTTVKQMIGRARPFVPDNVPAPFLYHPFSWSAAYASFPSGHSTTAFSVLVGFGVLWPVLRPVLWVYALLICASRVIVTAHHPSDVLGGIVVGTVGALLVRDWFAARRLVFIPEPDGRVRPMPGPSIRRLGRLLRRLVTRERSDSTEV